MPDRVFSYKGEQWSVGYAGASHGTGSVMPVAMTSHQMLFIRESDGLQLRGRLWTGDPREATDEQIVASLLAIKVANWRTTCPEGHQVSPSFDALDLDAMIGSGTVKVWCIRCGDEWSLGQQEVTNLRRWIRGETSATL
jgi:hypothetical protein